MQLVRRLRELQLARQRRAALVPAARLLVVCPSSREWTLSDRHRRTGRGRRGCGPRRARRAGRVVRVLQMFEVRVAFVTVVVGNLLNRPTAERTIPPPGPRPGE